jgi:DNA-directed RNA polymerase specialized sigma24 family protein
MTRACCWRPRKGITQRSGCFYRRWLPLVTGFHLRRTRSRELAFDLTAETVAAVVADVPRFDPDRGAPAGWLLEIAEHKLLDSVRRARVGGRFVLRVQRRPCVRRRPDHSRRGGHSSRPQHSVSAGAVLGGRWHP